MMELEMSVEILSDGRIQITVRPECPKGHPFPAALRFRERPQGWNWVCMYCKGAKQSDPGKKARQEQRRKFQEIGRDAVRKRNGLA